PPTHSSPAMGPRSAASGAGQALLVASLLASTAAGHPVTDPVNAVVPTVVPPSPLAAALASVIRYDRASPHTPEVHPATIDGPPGSNITASSNPPSSPPVVTQSSPSNPFTISFTCGAGVASARCQAVNAAFVSAGARIAKSLAITNPVSVSASFFSFGPAGSNTLGRASPAAYFSAIDVNPSSSSNSGLYSFYPQALVRQLPLDASLTYNTFDILAEFNSDFDFYASGSSSSPIGQNQTDIEFVIAHELTHGLGLDTSWIDYGALFSDPSLSIRNAPSFLAPSYFAQGASAATLTVTSWQPLTAFDDRIRVAQTKTPLSSLAKLIFSSFPSNPADPSTSSSKTFPMPLPSFLSSLASTASSTLISACTSAYQAATGNSTLEYAPLRSTGKSLTLATFPVIQPGSSIAHGDYALYSGTPDFLMIPNAGRWNGVALADVIKN
ncbi:hypothetical protein HK101_005848, partial [Irineochytrium annulatum]